MAEPNRFWAVYRYGTETLYLGDSGWDPDVDKATEFTYAEALGACGLLHMAPGSHYSIEPVIKVVYG